MPDFPGLSRFRPRLPALLAVLFLVFVPLVLFLPALISQQIYGVDVVAAWLPVRIEVQRILAAHQWPLWISSMNCGLPGIADVQFSLYPSDLLAVASGWSARLQFALDAVLHVALAGLGMFFFLRRLGRSVPASLLGGFFFAVSGSEISELLGGFYCFLESIALVPWIFWAAHKGFTEDSRFAWGLCGLALALQILALGSQIAIYTVPAVAAFILYLALRPASAPSAAPARARRGEVLRASKGLAFALALPFLIAAPLLWLTFQYLPFSIRHDFPYAKFIQGSIRLPEILSYVVPGFFGWAGPDYHGAKDYSFTTEYFGLLPWALAAGALAALWRREALVRWMAALALLGLFFAQREWTPFYPLISHLPVLSGLGTWSRTLFLVTFAVCVLAACGWDALRGGVQGAAAARGVAAFAALAAAAAACAWMLAPSVSSAAAGDPAWIAHLHGAPPPPVDELVLLARNSARACLLLAPALLLIAFGRARMSGGLLLILALGFHVCDQSQVAKRYIRFVDPPQAAEGAPASLPPPPGPDQEPWRIADTGSLRPNAAIAEGYDSASAWTNMPFQSDRRIMDSLLGRGNEWYDLVNVRYIVASTGGGAARVFENPRAFPRAWLVTRSVEVQGDEGAYRALADPRFDPRTEVALSGLPDWTGPPAAGEVRWVGRDSNDSTLRVRTQGQAFLVQSVAWYPSWRCEVDGREVPVLEADGGLQAVRLDAGVHTVAFHFDPGLFHAALAACLAGLLTVCAMGAREWWKGRLGV